MNGWLVFGVLVALYLGLVFALRGRAKPLPGNLQFHGPLLFWRTQWGKKAIERVARPRRFWNVVADAGVVLTWIVGVLVLVLLVVSVVPYFTSPDVVADNSPPPEFLIGIPGVNPLIPVGYGLLALVLALDIHEGSHGVMAYVARMRVKSLGLVAFVIPIGAFVEPDEEDLAKATTQEKNRLFAAGPTSNIVLALVAGVILSTAFLANVTLANEGQGVVLATVEPGSAAERAGLLPGDVLTAIDNKTIADRAAYTAAMNATSAGQQVGLTLLRDDRPLVLGATLTDKKDYVAKFTQDQAQIDAASGKGFLGVSGIGLDGIEGVHESLRSPFGSLSSFFFYLGYPFFIFQNGIDVMAPPYNDLFTVHGAMAALPAPVFWGLATLLYWVVWINLMLGTFNALPAGPLDGGQMFRATLSDRLMKRFRVRREHLVVERAEMGNLLVRGKDEETQVKLDRIHGLVSRATMTLGLFILALILLPLFGPPLLKLLG
jgi:membrane-associated protease RseP (regulator of RpoE activity)